MYRDWEIKVNETLTPYLEKEALGESESSGFYEAMGNNLLAVGLKPDALWAYQKSLKLYPWNPPLKQTVYRLQQQESLPQTAPWMIPEPFLYQFFAVVFVLCVLFWQKWNVRLIFGFLAAATLLLLAFSVWFLPASGVLLKSTYLRQLPSELSPIVTQNPLPSGLSVEILSYEGQGKWLKIKDSDGNIGFIFYESLRLI